MMCTYISPYFRGEHVTYVPHPSDIGTIMEHIFSAHVTWEKNVSRTEKGVHNTSRAATLRPTVSPLEWVKQTIITSLLAAKEGSDITSHLQ